MSPFGVYAEVHRLREPIEIKSSPIKVQLADSSMEIEFARKRILGFGSDQALQM